MARTSVGKVTRLAKSSAKALTACMSYNSGTASMMWLGRMTKCTAPGFGVTTGGGANSNARRRDDTPLS